MIETTISDQEFGLFQRLIYKIAGISLSDAKKILSITWEFKSEYYRYNKWFETQTQKITITNIPLIYAIGDVEWGIGARDKFLYQLGTTESIPQISFCEWSWTDSDGGNVVLGKSKIKRFDKPIEAKFMEKFPY